MRRPLRFLAWKLELEEPQVNTLATILDDLKTERAQAAVDERRATAAFAEVIAQAQVDPERLRAIAEERVNSARRVQASVATALQKIHALLDDEQRTKLAYLIRTGAITL